MSDEVKFIFKTLIKVPIMIFVAYVILNIFAFFFIYFKALGMSYVVMQTAVENNYLPTSELQTIYNYVDSWNDIAMVEDAKIVIYDDGTTIHTMNSLGDTAATYGENDARQRKQYGKNVTCGVTLNYTIVWPLSHRETLVGADLDINSADNTGVGGFNGNGAAVNSDTKRLEELRERKAYQFPITITYTVPGLKYYPDMLTY